ncbi:hypothetical protein Btru_047156 [Bulinus truncatus]|nr:hypothetical protein Btru_047156 [Bulinus truncatus]
MSMKLSENNKVVRPRIVVCFVMFVTSFIMLVIGAFRPYWFWSEKTNYHFEMVSPYAGKSEFTGVIWCLMIVSLLLGALCLLISFLMVFGELNNHLKELQYVAFRINVAVAALAGLYALHSCVLFVVDIYAAGPYAGRASHSPVPGTSFYLVMAAGFLDLISGWLCSTLEGDFTEPVQNVDQMELHLDH